MPGIEAEPPLLKTHKTLRRTKDISPVEAVQLLSAQDSSPPNGTAIATAPSLPLTPPVLAQEDSASGSELQKNGSVKSGRRSLPVVTPPRHLYTLTPEITPPRNASPNRLDASQVAQPLSSSRAESFRTACETIPSDEDTDNSRSSRSLQQSKQSARLFQRNGHQTDSMNLDPNSPSIFDSLDGQWANIRKRQHRSEVPAARTNLRLASNDSQTMADASALEIPDKRASGDNSRARVGDAENITPVERFREDIGWPAENSSTPTERPDSRRLSGHSATSAVEALIIDSPQPAKRALRHTEKRLSLRSASSPMTKSERTSMASNPESRHRLVHKAARITDQDRRSVASDPSASASSTLGAVRPNVDVVPVVVIPERRSSLHCSNQNSRNPSQPCSGRSSQRTAASRTGSRDRPRRSRALSESTEGSSRARTFSRPVVPPRSSSLSAPTSRNNSQATSLTSESLRHHTLATEAPRNPEVNDPGASEQKHDAQDNSTGHPAITVEDMSGLAPPSLPFAQGQGSIHSLSPGPVEINEATTVSFFPHNNNSLVVVDKNMLPESRAVQAVRANYRDKLDAPRTPENPTQTQADFDSPLRNPRPPPELPAYKELPPTPSGQAGENGLGRHFGSVRRALSGRSGSSNPVGRSFSTSAKSRKASGDIDSKLHSFWWPRRFWDDTDTVNGSPRKEASGTRDPPENQVISNSLGMPQERVIFEGPRLDRRSPEMRRFVDGISMRHYPSRRNLVGNRVLSPDIIRAASPLYQRSMPLIPRLRLRFRSIRLRGLRKHMKRSARQREERRLEARRETLKRSIGDVVHVDTSAMLSESR